MLSKVQNRLDYYNKYQIKILDINTIEITDLITFKNYIKAINKYKKGQHIALDLRRCSA